MKKNKEVSLVERAKSGNSGCRHCGKLIDFHQVRYGVKATSKSYGEYFKYYHPKCAIDAKLKFSKNLEKDLQLDKYLLAAEKEAEKYRQKNNCTCATYLLMSNDCECKDTEAEQEEVVEECDSSQTECESSQKLPSAKQVLQQAVSNHYAEAAKKVSDQIAKIHVDSEAFIPGLKVKHKIDNREYTLLHLNEHGWSVTDDNYKIFNFQPALLTVATDEGSAAEEPAWPVILMAMTGIIFGSVLPYLIAAIIHFNRS